MKYAVGLMACIAIAFLMITSPERSQMHAQQAGIAEELPSLEVRPPVDDKLDGKLDSIIDMLATQKLNIESIDSIASQTAVELEDTKQRLVALETAKSEQPTPAMQACDCDCDALKEQHAELEKRIAALEALRTQLSTSNSVGGGSTGSVVYKSVSGTSGYSSVGSSSIGYGSTGSSAVRQPMRNTLSAAATIATAPVRAAASYKPRWQNYDGKSRMQHAIEDHGMDITGKSESQILMEMDAYHDRYGGGHPVKMSSVSYSSSYPSSPVYSSVSSCPGGVCPTGPQLSRSTSSGWYLGKALGRRR